MLKSPARETDVFYHKMLKSFRTLNTCVYLESSFLPEHRAIPCPGGIIRYASKKPGGALTFLPTKTPNAISRRGVSRRSALDPDTNNQIIQPQKHPPLNSRNAPHTHSAHH